MPQFIVNLFHNYGSYVVILIAAYLLNLLYGHKSQVDAWCNANPKRAAVMKLIRGILPIDPWMIIQGLSLLFKGKLPVKWQKIVTVLPTITEVTSVKSEVTSVTSASVTSEITPGKEEIPSEPPVT